MITFLNLRTQDLSIFTFFFGKFDVTGQLPVLTKEGNTRKGHDKATRIPPFFNVKKIKQKGHFENVSVYHFEK